MRAGNRIDVSVERSSTPTISPKELPIERAGAKSSVRFTSNVVGSLFLVSDILCFVISAPIALLAYAMIRGSAIVPQVHLFAIALMLGSFLLIRSSRQTYRRTLFDPLDGYGTAAFDAGVSSLIASALIWQAGLVKDYSRGVAILMLLSVVVCLRLSQPSAAKSSNGLRFMERTPRRLPIYGSSSPRISSSICASSGLPTIAPPQKERATCRPWVVLTTCASSRAEENSIRSSLTALLSVRSESRRLSKG